MRGYRLRVAGAADVVLPGRLRNVHDPWSGAGDLLGVLLPGAVAATMPGFERLGQALERHVVTGLARQALARAAGSPVDLGPVRLGAATISAGRRPPVRWQDVTAWQVDGDVLRIDSTGGRGTRLRVDLSTVPDGWVVVQALTLRGGRQPGQE